MISSFGTEESILQPQDKAHNPVCLQCMVCVLHWEFVESFHLQKQSAHIILDADMQANSDELFTRLDWLPPYLTVPNSLEKIEYVHSFKKALIDFYASS